MPPETDAEKITRLERKIGELQAENERLRRALEEALRAVKRQAAPFSVAIPRLILTNLDAKAGDRYGRRCRRPIPRKIDEIVEVPLPEQCPHCGGRVEEGSIVSQYQSEIPNRERNRLSFVFMWDAVGVATSGCKADIRARLRMRLAALRRNWDHEPRRWPRN